MLDVMSLICSDPILGQGHPSRSFAITLTRHTTHGETPLNMWSARRRALYLTTHNTHERKSVPHGGIRTRNPSKRAAADPRLRPRGRSCPQGQLYVSPFNSHVTVSIVFQSSSKEPQLRIMRVRIIPDVLRPNPTPVECYNYCLRKLIVRLYYYLKITV